MKKSRMLIKQILLFSFSCLLLTASLTTARAAGEVDPTFNAAAQSTTSASVRTIVTQPDGKLLVGGQFTVAGNSARNGIARFNADGSLDTTFNPPEFSASAIIQNFSDSVIIYAVAVQSDGKILVGGNFVRVNNQIKYNLVRLNADGSVDTTLADFGTSSFIVLDIKIQNDNRIVVSGNQGISRLNSDGSRDTTLQLSIGEIVSIVIQPDGKIVIGNNNSGSVYRLNADGTTDNTFFPASVLNIFKLALQPDGKILIGSGFGIRRLNANGSPDASFNPGGTGTNGGRVNGIALLPDGKIIIVGFFTTYNGVSRLNAARLYNDGTLDPGFNYTPISNFLLYAVAVSNDGKVLVGGGETNPNGSKLSRLNADGSIDTAFLGAVYGRGIVYKILPQADGKVLVAGAFNKINGVTRQIIARLNADGSPDAGFVPPSLSGIGLTIALQTDGKILLSKDLVSVNPGDTQHVVRLNSDGSLDSSFQTPSLSGGGVTRVTEIAALPDNKIIIGGSFAISNSLINLARLNANGSVDTTFTKSVTSIDGNRGTILALKVQPNGKILIGGNFTRVETAVRNRIARINADGTLDETFNQPFGINGDVYDLALQSNGSVVIGGPFTQVNANSNFRYLARLFPDASLDTSFNPQPSGTVHSLENQPDDKIVFGGLFNTVSGVARNNLARLNSNGTLDNSFIGSGANDITFSINARSDGRILIGGQFTRVNGVSSVGIARLLNQAPATRTPFDFDGDGRADVSVFRPASGVWYLSTDPAVNYGAVQFGVASDKLVPADYDGDGKTDVAVFRDGRWYLLRSQAGFTDVSFGLSSDVPVPADYDGDGRADVAVFRPSNATWYLLRSNLGYTSVELGLGTDKPVPADYDGDGRAEAAVFRPSNGTWYNSTNPATNYGGVQFGASGDQAVPADYDGDGKIDRAVFRPANGTWYLLQSSAGFVGISFGQNGDLPSAADYDGDGKADVAVFRNGTWYLNRTNAGFTSVNFGVGDDKPTPNSFVR